MVDIEHSMHEKAKTFAPRDYGWAMVRHAPSSNSRLYKILGGATARTSPRLQDLGWNTIRLTNGAEP